MTMDVLMFSPGFPAEMPYFTRGLAEVGVRVWGLGDQPVSSIPDVARHALSGYLRVPHLWNPDSVLTELRSWGQGPRSLDRIECLWEPGMMIAAQLRAALGLPGMTPEETLPFRDKGVMKEVLDRAGLRTPRYRRAGDLREIEQAAEEIGFPLILKPIAGAGSADTYEVHDRAELEAALPRVRHVDEISVEEFIEGEEYTFDTICSDGVIHYENVAWYRPKPLIARSVQWISPQTVTLREVPGELDPGVELGRRVLQALGFRTGFTHMEWFLKSDGEAVFGEIGARPPGARSVELMNYACDLDVFRGWAEATCHGRFEQTIHRRYNAAVIFKRAQGEGRIQRIEGLESILGRFGPHVTCVNLLPPGARRRNWKQTLISDGYLILRHPDLGVTLAMADRVGTHLRIYAG